VDNATSGVLTLTITGAVPSTASDMFAEEELKLVIQAAATDSSTDIVVLTAPGNVVLTAKPKLTIAILED
jgi:hypothetical protein